MRCKNYDRYACVGVDICIYVCTLCLFCTFKDSDCTCVNVLMETHYKGHVLIIGILKKAKESS